jgi:putative transferase (TIGR04331 family)
LARDAKVRDLPHPMFSRSGRSLPNEDVVIVATALDLHDIRLIRAQQGDQAFDYLDRQARLWKAVAGALPGRVFYRLHAVDHGWNLRRRFQDRCPDVRFDDASTPFSERLRGVRLLIFDNPMTTFVEAFGADRPCLLTWNPEIWRFRPAAQPFLDRLREAGIFFDAPEAAARHAAAIHADPRAWWDEPKRRAVHREFAARFALTSADWLKVWLEELAAA